MFKCSECESTFKTKFSLNYHVNVEHTGIRFKCGKCHKTFVTKSNVQRHINEVHDKNEIEIIELIVDINSDATAISEDPVKTIENDLTIHECALHSSNVHKMSIEKITDVPIDETKGKDVQQENNFQADSTILVESPKQFPCGLCEMSCKSRPELKHHISSVHFGLRLKCPSCEKLFIKSQYLNEHLKNSHDISEYTEKIEKVFIDVEEEKIELEGKIKEVRIDVEAEESELKKSKLFISKDGLKTFKCDICDVLFDDFSKMKGHFITKHGGMYFQCRKCPEWFSKGIRFVFK
jgi:uncharacterized C2H2 Zn-finger protein